MPLKSSKEFRRFKAADYGTSLDIARRLGA